MAQASRKTEIGLATTWVRHIRHALRESAFLLLVGCGGFFLIALLTYNPHDPAWSSIGGHTEIANYGGVIGAWFADVFFYFLGFMAFALPIGLIYAAWYLTRVETWEGLDGEVVLFRSMGTGVTLTAGCALATLLLPAIAQGSGGGILGDAVSRTIVGAFGPAGGSLFLLALFLAGFTLTTGVSWVGLLDWVGRWTWKGIVALVAVPALLWQYGQTIRARQAEADAEQPLSPESESVIPVSTPPTEVVEPVMPVQTPPPIMETDVELQPEPKPEPERVMSRHARIEPTLSAEEADDLWDKPEPQITTETTFDVEPLVDGSWQSDQRLPDIQDDEPALAVPPAPPVETPVAPMPAAPIVPSVVVPPVERPVAPMPAAPIVPSVVTPPVAKPVAPMPAAPILPSVVAPPVETPVAPMPAAPIVPLVVAPPVAKPVAPMPAAPILPSVVTPPVEKPVAPMPAAPILSPSPAPLAAADKLDPPAAEDDDDDEQEVLEPESEFDSEADSEPPVFALPALFKSTLAAPSAPPPVVPLVPPVAWPELVKRTPSPLPPLDLLDQVSSEIQGYSEEELETMSVQLENLLASFGVKVEVVNVEPGPVITRFEIDPAPGVKVNQITNLSKDLARGLSVTSVRVVEVIPGKSFVGLEIPNQRRQIVYLGEILSSSLYQSASSPLTLVLGKDIGGRPVVANLGKMPHLLVAGTTGSGKSVAINTMLLSLLYKATPDDVRLILIDPKMLELSVYEDIPHLLAPVVTDMKEAANALRWCVAEMERRYRLMATLKVRNIAGFNRQVRDAIEAGQPLRDPLYKPSAEMAGQPIPTLAPLPFIVVVIDELADMMMIVGKKVEELIARLAQKARASGIHLILATQRPSVDVITGLIKANIPTRIAFQVSSKVDSRTILDQMGAENLLGHGDMLFHPPGSGFTERVHGAFVDDHEVNRVVEYIKQHGEPNYIEDILEEPVEVPDNVAAFIGGDTSNETDVLFDQAVQVVTESRKASISSVQRRLRIGYNRAARLIEDMEAAGIVGPPQHNGIREVLAPPPPEV